MLHCDFATCATCKCLKMQLDIHIAMPCNSLYCPGCMGKWHSMSAAAGAPVTIRLYIDSSAAKSMHESEEHRLEHARLLVMRQPCQSHVHCQYQHCQCCWHRVLNSTCIARPLIVCATAIVAGRQPIIIARISRRRARLLKLCRGCLWWLVRCASWHAYTISVLGITGQGFQ